MGPALLTVLAITASACGPALVTPPAGPGTHRSLTKNTGPDFEPWTNCNEILNISARVSIRGRAGGHSVNTTLSMGAQGYPAAGVRIESYDKQSPPRFIVAGDDHQATLLLPREERRVRMSTKAAVETAIGLPLDANDVQTILKGCQFPQGEEGWDLDATWQRLQMDPTGDEMYGRRVAPDGWDFVLFVRSPPDSLIRWRAEFAHRVQTVPRRVRLTSLTWSGEPGRAFDVRLSLDNVQVNAIVSPEVFRLSEAPGQPIEIGTLTNAMPLAARYWPAARRD